MSVQLSAVETALMGQATGPDYKGDLLTLKTGCGHCAKCRRQLLELLEHHHTIRAEENKPEVTKHAETMLLAGQVMGHALRYAKGDLVVAQLLLKIALNSIETITSAENIRTIMGTMAKAMRDSKAEDGSPFGNTHPKSWMS